MAVTPADDAYTLRIGDAELHVTDAYVDEDSVCAVVEGRKVTGEVVVNGVDVTVFAGATAYEFKLVDPALLAGADDGEAPVFAAPMPGKVVAVNVAAGDAVAAGTTLVVLEAMKMEHAIKAPVDGRVSAVHYAVGDQVEEGVDLIAFEAAESEE